MRSLKLIIICCFYLVFAKSQEVVSVSLKGSRTKQQITSLFSLPLIKYGAKYYQVLYTSTDAKGAKDTLSGLLVVPDNLNNKYPKLIYQHGTSDCKKCVPSNYGTSGGEEGQLGLLFAGLGYVSLLPDYVGMGTGRGFQTYVHDATTISATADMLDAVSSWTDQNNILTNDQLFITGYSQGGYAAMSFHRYMETTKGAASVTAAAHLSGPYSLSGAMRDLILSENEYSYPAYIPNTVLGFNEAYGIYNNLSEIFKQEYIADITKYYQGSIGLVDLNIRLAQLLKANTGAIVGGRMLKDDFLNEIRTNPDHIINKILKENDVYDWKPEAPTRIFYCKADDQVPYINSIIAYDTMIVNGASKLEIMDVNSTANHGTCFTPAMTNTLLFFLGFQSITIDVEDGLTELASWAIVSNPVDDVLQIVSKQNNYSIAIHDISGRNLMMRQISETIGNIDVSHLNAGMYFVTFTSQDGKAHATKKLIVAR